MTLLPINSHNCKRMIRGLLGVIALPLLTFTEPSQPLLKKHAREVIDEQGFRIFSPTALQQDSHGFYYIGTQTGLYLYDGNRFEHFEHDPANPHSLSANWITELYEDKRGHIWVGTRDGLNRFDVENWRFDRFIQMPGTPNRLEDNYIRSIAEDPQGNFWVATRCAVHRMDPATGIVKWLFQIPSTTQYNDMDRLITAHLDRAGMLWIATEALGLMRMNPETRDYEVFNHDPENPDTLYSNYVNQILEDEKGNIWAGCVSEIWHTQNSGMAGLCRYQPRENKFIRIPVPAIPATDTVRSSVNSLAEDTEGRIWVGRSSGEIALYNPENKKFRSVIEASGQTWNQVSALSVDRSGVLYFGTRYSPLQSINLLTLAVSGYSHNPAERLSLSDSHVTAIFADSESKTWIGTFNGGVNVVDEQNQTVRVFRQSDSTTGQPEKLSIDRVSSITEDRFGRVWIGLYGGGLFAYNRETDQLESWTRHDHPRGFPLADLRIRTLLADRHDRLWIGSRGGLSSIDLKTMTYHNHPLHIEQQWLSRRNQIMALYEDSSGTIWVATEHGMISYDPTLGQTAAYVHNVADPHSISYNEVRCFQEDSNGNFWVGTRGGLNLFNKTDGTFRRYTEANGLPVSVIYGIQEDSGGSLWLSTTNGLLRFFPEQNTFQRYSIELGFRNLQYEIGAYCAGDNGRLYFGGPNGLDTFYPGQMQLPASPPRIVLSQIHVLGETVATGPAAARLESLRIQPHQQHIGIEFAALDYIHPQRNIYRFRLQGFNDEWIQSGYRNIAYYTNLPPGTYRFEVMGANSLNIWSAEPATIELIVEPHLWQRRDAQIAFQLVIALLIVLAHVLITRNLKAARDHAEQLATKAEVANEAKTQFLTNMSHEIRTPLNAVIGMASLLKKTPLDDEQTICAETISDSAQLLLQLINDILDLAKIEAGHITSEETPFPLENTVREIGRICRFSAEEHSLTFNLEYDTSIPSFLIGDPLLLRQILLNLTQNAIKFTDHGSVTLRVHPAPSEDTSAHEPDIIRVQFQIEDTGIGIPEDKIAVIFQPFTQVDPSLKRKYGGTGLGLSIAAQLIRKLGGRMQVQSEHHKGTTFTVSIPFHIALHQQNITPAANTPDPFTDEKPLPSLHILVVEDNRINQRVIKLLLKRMGLNPVICNDGESALEWLRDHQADLIFMDVQMPGIDGFEATRRLRNSTCPNRSTPVIGLSANAMKQSHDQGISAGMNAYLSKPITYEKLRTAIIRWTLQT